MKLSTTTALLHALATEGNEVAWSEFVTRYSPIIEGVTHRLGLPKGDADDIAQQTLLEFLRDVRAGKFDQSRGRLRNWLLSIACHRVRDFQRSTLRRYPTVSISDCVDTPDVPRVTEIWIVEERKALVEEALRRLGTNTSLDPRTVRAFELTVLRGVPAEAAGQECGMSAAEVYVARSRAAGKLKEIVRELEKFYETEPVA